MHGGDSHQNLAQAQQSLQEYQKQMLSLRGIHLGVKDLHPYIRTSVLPRLLRRFRAQRQVLLLAKSLDVESTSRFGLCKSGFRGKNRAV